jgi:hypothetical protein
LLIYGAGALGRGIERQLAKVGQKVLGIAKLPEHVVAIEAHGL